MLCRLLARIFSTRALCALWVLTVSLPGVSRALDQSVVNERWGALLVALNNHDLSLAHEHVEELSLLRRKLGYDSMSRYSEELILRGRSAYEKGDVDASAFLCKSALALSPRHPEVMLHAITLCHRAGVDRKFSQLYQVLRANYDNPLMLLRVLRTTWYPILHAMTGGVLFVLIIYLVWHIQRSLTVLKQLMPFKSVVLATCVYVGAVLAPMMHGPLWCLTVWSALVLLCAPWHRAGVLFAGLTLALWGVSIPLRENLARWLAYPGLSEAVELATSRLDLSHNLNNVQRQLESLSRTRSKDSMPRFALARLYGLRGEYEKGGEVLGMLDPVYERQGWIASERGTWAFVQGKLDQADKLYQDAERVGQHSAEFLYNVSLLKAELVDLPGTRAYLERARAANKRRTDELASRELEIKVEERRFAVPVPLSLALIWESVSVPVPGDNVIEEEFSNLLMTGSDPLIMMAIGFALLVATLLRGEGKHLLAIKNARNLYKPPAPVEWLIRIVPGGSWALKGSLVAAMVLSAVFVFLLLPSTPYFPEATFWLYNMAGIKQIYLSTVGVITVLVVFIGSQLDLAE